MNMDMVENIHLPCNFLIIVDKYYPHDRPIVRCLDSGYTCIHINDDGILVHHDLQDNWSPICALGDIIKSIQNIRLFVYKLQSLYGGENILAESQFDTTSINATSVKERVAVEAVAYADEQSHMVVDNHHYDNVESDMMADTDEEDNDESHFQRSVVSMTENIDDGMFS